MKKILAMIPALVLAFSLQAQQLHLVHLFTDHAVLQQETTVPIWGWGKPGATVSVYTSWDYETRKNVVGPEGRWRVDVTTAQAGGPYHIKVSCAGESVRIEDIMLGEVWICSGQSNMEMPVSGFGFQGVEGSTEAILEAPVTADAIRVFDIKTGKRTEAQDDVDCVWTLSNGEVVSRTSAIGYFFAKRLHASLNVPVGIIVNAWGGSRIEPWMTRGTIDAAGITPEERAAIDAIEEKPDRWPETPELIWNGRVAPIVGYAARGFLWYQGCSNIGQLCYDKLQNAMVRFWREKWGRGDMPFIYTLLAPYEHEDADGRWRPQFVEAQLRTQDSLPQSWAVCTETLGDRQTVHPAKKREVADMMVLRALQNVYGVNTGISMELPRLQNVVYEADGTVKVTLTQVWSNLMGISAREVVGFELSGEDRQFHLATAEVDWDGQTLLVRCPEVPHPVAVRYGWRNWMGANLQKTNGIPVPPFRSDDWEY